MQFRRLYVPFVHVIWRPVCAPKMFCVHQASHNTVVAGSLALPALLHNTDHAEWLTATVRLQTPCSRQQGLMQLQQALKATIIMQSCKVTVHSNDFIVSLVLTHWPQHDNDVIVICLNQMYDSA